MAITYIGAGVTTLPNQSGNAGITVTPDAGTLTNDLMLFISYRDDRDTPQDPISPGWTTLAYESETSNDQCCTAVAYKIAESDSEGAATFFWDDAGSEQWVAAILTFRGVDTTTPFDVVYEKALHYTRVVNKVSPNNDAFNPITTVSNGAFVIPFEGAGNGGITTAEDPPGYTNSVREIGLNYRQLQIWYREVATAGVEMPGVAPYLSGTPNSAMWTLAIRPDGAGPGPGPSIAPLAMHHQQQQR